MHHTRVLRPAGGIVAFYDGRVEGYRLQRRRDEPALRDAPLAELVADSVRRLDHVFRALWGGAQREHRRHDGPCAVMRPTPDAYCWFSSPWAG